jgi:DNA-binding Lrp family transcriptional regulator
MLAQENSDLNESILKAIEGDFGASITEIVERTGISRSAVRTALAQLEGANLVTFRKIGMAKLYKVKHGN